MLRTVYNPHGKEASPHMYDTIAHEYRTIARDLGMPLHRSELYTFAQLIGDVQGKSVLDLGCGEGFYTRRLRQLGAARVVGADISEEMVALAQQAEALAPLGIDYMVADVRTAGRIVEFGGEFDLVVSFFMLNHAVDRADLLSMCEGIAANLKPGGRFFAFNNNLDLPPAAYGLLEKYGRFQRAPEPLVEGTPITVTIRRNGEDCTFVDCYLSRATYAWTLGAAGLHSLVWHQPQVPPEDLQGEGQTYWQDFLNYPTFVAIEAAAA
jgi:2-polyprenyl-3-methyl-5-hydroxy-6-metoxy-1,4-benzoquinol methylase